MSSTTSPSAAAERRREYRMATMQRVIEGDREAMLARDREDMRCFVKNRKKTTGTSGEEITVTPSNTVLWPRVQQILDVLRNPELSEEERDFYSQRYKIFMKRDPPFRSPADELTNDRDRMHNMYKERRKTLLRQLEKERDPAKIPEIQEQLARVRKEPVRPTNVVLWPIVEEVYRDCYDMRRSEAERLHSMQRYIIYMKTAPVPPSAIGAAAGGAGAAPGPSNPGGDSEPLARWTVSETRKKSSKNSKKVEE